MTIILDLDEEHFYSLFWSDVDEFKKLRFKEISFDEVKTLCKWGDCIKIQRLHEALLTEAP